ncbi:MAG: hypothetical protein CYG60_16895, partial [Actinobacteria bacterium]
MASYNHVTLMGNITRDPELGFTQAGRPYVQIGLAVNESWKDAQGNKQERVHFFDVTAWGSLAETIANYKKKGDPILIDGKLQYRQWDAQDGSKRSKVDVVANSVQFLPRGGGDNGQTQQRPQRPQRQQQRPQRQQQQQQRQPVPQNP